MIIWYDNMAILKVYILVYNSGAGRYNDKLLLMEEILLTPTIYHQLYQSCNIYILGILCSKSQNASQIGWFLKGPGSQMNLFSTCMRLYETYPTYYIPKDERIQPTFQTYPWMIAFLQYKELCVRWKPFVALCVLIQFTAPKWDWSMTPTMTPCRSSVKLVSVPWKMGSSNFCLRNEMVTSILNNIWKTDQFLCNGYLQTYFQFEARISIVAFLPCHV